MQYATVRFRAEGPSGPSELSRETPPRFHHDGGGWGAAAGLKLADRLATLEVYLGITPQQQDAWRTFTQAALAMIPDPDEMHRDMAGGAFDGIAHMTARLQRMAEEAQKLAQAAEALKAVLTPEQIRKADVAWTTLRAIREHHFHHHAQDGSKTG